MNNYTDFLYSSYVEEDVDNLPLIKVWYFHDLSGLVKQQDMFTQHNYKKPPILIRQWIHRDRPISTSGSYVEQEYKV